MLFLYLVLIGSFFIGFRKMPVFLEKEMVPRTGFSLVVVYRNEAENLPELLNSIVALDYPRELFEVFLVNDHSEDASVGICERYAKDFPEIRFQLLNAESSLSPKKDAIFLAAGKARFEYLTITDADCLLPSQWLRNFDQLLQEESPVLIAGPVGFRHAMSVGFSEAFEEIDFLSLQGSTIGGFGMNKPFMCNSANLCYRKSAYLHLQQQRRDLGIASGDDVFLLQHFTASASGKFCKIREKHRANWFSEKFPTALATGAMGGKNFSLSGCFWKDCGNRGFLHEPDDGDLVFPRSFTVLEFSAGLRNDTGQIFSGFPAYCGYRQILPKKGSVTKLLVGGGDLSLFQYGRRAKVSFRRVLLERKTFQKIRIR